MKRIAFQFRPIVLSLCALALILGEPVLRAAAQTLPAVDDVAIRLKNSTCVPGKCLCSGSFKPDTWLQWYGPRPRGLASGIACIVADFDGNGANDYALPGGEGLATVVLMNKAGFKQAVYLDAGGGLELYEPRKSTGPKGEPASSQPGLLVRHVGPNHIIFLWRKNEFARIAIPAS